MSTFELNRFLLNLNDRLNSTKQKPLRTERLFFINIIKSMHALRYKIVLARQNKSQIAAVGHGQLGSVGGI